MPRLDERRAARRGVRATDHRRELEARLVEKDQVGSPLPSLLEDAGELLGPSVGDPLFIPLPGLLLRPLAAPTQPPSEDLADVLDVVLDAEAAADEFATRPALHRSLGQPWARAPSSSRRSSSPTCSSLSRARGPGWGLAARASGDSSAKASQRYSEVRPTPRMRATTLGDSSRRISSTA
jgi:hypothetical protein